MSRVPVVRPPKGKVVVSYGGGVNSVAVLVLLAHNRVRPEVILMADPGAEWTATVRYLNEVTQPFLSSVGFPPVTVITRIEEGQYRSRAWRLETLKDECFRTKSLPSVAYGWKKCSLKYKAETQMWWQSRQPWIQAEWAAGRRLVKTIGYDYGETARVEKGLSFGSEWEQERFIPWYPLYQAKLDREACIQLINDAGLPAPPKSACTFCPNNKLEEWIQLRDEEPEAFAEAVEMSRRAVETITQPDVVGLMRCNPHGMRQLHVWADGGYPEIPQDLECETEQPCDCAL